MAVSEELITRLELVGLGEFRGGMEQGARAFGLFKKGADEAGLAQLGMGLAVGAAGVGIAAKLLEMGKAAAEEESIFARASRNFTSMGRSLPVEEIRRFSGELEQQTAVSRESIANTLGLLASFGATGRQAEALTPAILNVAEALKAQGVSAETLAVQIGRAMQTGNLGRLKRILPVNEIKFQTDRVGALMDAMAKKGGKSAEEFAQSSEGQMLRANLAMDALQKSIGRVVAGPLGTIAGKVADFSDNLEKIPGATTAIGVGLGAVAVGLIAYGGYSIWSTFQTQRLARAHYEAAAAARAQAAAEADLTKTVAVGGGAAAVRSGTAPAAAAVAGGGAAAVARVAGPVGLAIGASVLAKELAAPLIENLRTRGVLGGAVAEGLERATNPLGVLVRDFRGVEDFFTGHKAGPETPKGDPVVSELEKQTAIMQENLKALTGMSLGSQELEKALGEARLRAIVRSPERALARNLA